MKIITFNIMHNTYTNKEKYPYCEEKYLDYNYRINLIKDIITSKNIDIICLQEADSLRLDDFNLENYLMFYQNDKTRQKKIDKYKAGEITKIHSLINIILINKNLEISDINFRSFSRYISCSFYYKEILLEITNVHLELNCEKSRLQHLNKIMTFYSLCAAQSAHIIIGDFNDSDENLDKILINYENSYNKLGFPKFTFKGYDEGFNELIIDHLYHTKNIKCLNYFMQNENIIPSDTYPSDHLYIIFDISITNT